MMGSACGGCDTAASECGAWWLGNRAMSDSNFRSWHDGVFGYGYGSGEQFWLPALHLFFTELVNDGGQYSASEVELALGPLAAWLLINDLCAEGVLEYGTSPRFGWLSERGLKLRAFVALYTEDALYDVVRDMAAVDADDACCDSCDHREDGA